MAVPYAASMKGGVDKFVRRELDALVEYVKSNMVLRAWHGFP